MKRDIKIYLKDNSIINVNNVYQYDIYHKINMLEITTRHISKNLKTNDEDYHLETKRYNLTDIIQVDITTRTNNDYTTDFILL